MTRMLLRKTIPNWLLVIFLLVSFVGLADAGYLTYKHYTHSPLNCSILDGCSDVTESTYATVFGNPVSLGGVAYYALIFLLTFLYANWPSERISWLLARIPILGLLASVYFVFLQVFVIKAICIYCMASALTSTLLFIAGIAVLKITKSVDKK